ncbi:hypothetical protein B0H19DRAFT_1055289 [Mycena capillaripes]|nr:hypothetical protein B0H19DRAFT_1055289 [Mycena capillaripes]
MPRWHPSQGKRFSIFAGACKKRATLAQSKHHFHPRKILYQNPAKHRNPDCKQEPRAAVGRKEGEGGACFVDACGMGYPKERRAHKHGAPDNPISNSEDGNGKRPRIGACGPEQKEGERKGGGRGERAEEQRTEAVTPLSEADLDAGVERHPVQVLGRAVEGEVLAPVVGSQPRGVRESECSEQEQRSVEAASRREGETKTKGNWGDWLCQVSEFKKKRRCTALKPPRLAQPRGELFCGRSAADPDGRQHKLNEE